MAKNEKSNAISLKRQKYGSLSKTFKGRKANFATSAKTNISQSFHNFNKGPGKYICSGKILLIQHSFSSL